MHPAYSVIVFTCASGAGLGMLVWLGLGAITGSAGARLAAPTMIAMLAAALLVTIGLLSSTLHLGRPERAWRAFSQWRSSWLSREGVMAVATYAAALPFALGWWYGSPFVIVAVLALATVLAALATLWCTGMIYASLTTIRGWNHSLVAPLYVVLGICTGRILMNAIAVVANGSLSVRAAWLTLVILVSGWILKTVYWSSIDDAPRPHTIGDATGLGRFGVVRPLEAPHTMPNFVMREMGYAVARRHAVRLRQLATLLLFVVPIAATILLLLSSGAMAMLFASVAALCAVAGVVVERWLFFAEAEHVSMLFYGRPAA